MIRRETATHWILVTHPDHARLAGEFADAWGNALFARPEPYTHIRYAVYHHDDGWKPRDATPSLTRENKPEAFTNALVGAYSAFEEIDLPSYLAVRGAATAAVAADDVYAGVITSMHTCNLLTEQADLASIRPEHRPAHAAFLAEQVAWQRTTGTALGAQPAQLLRGFEFLQCCDNLSLIVCSRYDQPRDLRFAQPDIHGQRHPIRCTPVSTDTYTLSPWPLASPELVLTLPFRAVPKTATTSLAAFREAFTAAPLEHLAITLRPAAP
jgi:hypothetical protein